MRQQQLRASRANSVLTAAQERYTGGAMACRRRSARPKRLGHVGPGDGAALDDFGVAGDDEDACRARRRTHARRDAAEGPPMPAPALVTPSKLASRCPVLTTASVAPTPYLVGAPCVNPIPAQARARIVQRPLPRPRAIPPRGCPPANLSRSLRLSRPSVLLPVPTNTPLFVWGQRRHFGERTRGPVARRAPLFAPIHNRGGHHADINDDRTWRNPRAPPSGHADGRSAVGSRIARASDRLC